MRVKKTKPPTLLEAGCLASMQDLLHGTVLAIDPSSGSANSQPGYAIFEGGRFVDCGVINLPRGSDLNVRLYQLGKTLRESFTTPNVLVTEKISPIANGSFNARSMASLQKAIGVTISSFNCPLVEVSPISWRKNIPLDGYVKRDDHDAVLMGFTAILVAHRMNGTIIEGLPPEIVSRITVGG